MKKLFTLFFALVTSTGTMFAESGACGENLTWDLTNGVLTISGTGAMTDFEWDNIPWYSYCESITRITIGNSVTSIGSFAFPGCTGLTSIEIPNSVTSIGTCAFYGCSSLTSVTIPNSVTSIGESAFFNCSSLTSVIIPNSVTNIGREAFSGCSGLTSIAIPNSVDSIGSRVYFGCTNLISLKIPANIPQIDYYGYVENIAGYYYPGNTQPYYITGLDNLKSVEAPAWFFDAPEKIWSYCPNDLEYVGVNNGELTDNALSVIKRSYKTLKSIDVAGTTNTELADEAFKECYNLQTLVLPASLEKISYMAVADCRNLQSIDIPASVEEIDQSAFENCRSLQTITFGGAQPSPMPGRHFAPMAASQLKKIGNWAFYNAHELQHLEIPEGVTEIGDAAFYGCTYLEDLVLPASVQSIGDNCFALCEKLGKIVVNSVTPPTIAAKTFFDVKRQIPVYVPDDCVEAYEGDKYWGEFDIQGISHMPQGIDDVVSGSAPQKLIRNGQIFILRGEKVYTLQGQEVQ